MRETSAELPGQIGGEASGKRLTVLSTFLAALFVLDEPPAHLPIGRCHDSIHGSGRCTSASRDHLGDAVQDVVVALGPRGGFIAHGANYGRVPHWRQSSASCLARCVVFASYLRRNRARSPTHNDRQGPLRFGTLRARDRSALLFHEGSRGKSNLDSARPRNGGSCICVRGRAQDELRYRFSYEVASVGRPRYRQTDLRYPSVRSSS